MHTKYKTEILSITPVKTVANNSNNNHINNVLDRCRAVNYEGEIAYFCSDLKKISPELKESVKQLRKKHTKDPEGKTLIKAQVSSIKEGQTNRAGTVQNRFIVRKEVLLPFIGAQAEVATKAEIAPELDFDKPKKIEQEASNIQSLDPSSIDIEEIKSLTRQAKELTPEEKVKKHINWIVQTQAENRQKAYLAEGKNSEIGLCRSQVYREMYTAFDKVVAQKLAERGQKLKDVGLGMQTKGYINVIMSKGFIVVLQEVARELFNVK
jgi:hypothetical protein